MLHFLVCGSALTLGYWIVVPASVCYMLYSFNAKQTIEKYVESCRVSSNLPLWDIFVINVQFKAAVIE